MLLRNRSCVCPERVLVINSIRSLLAFISMRKLTTKRLFCAEHLAALAPGLGEEADASRHVLALLEPAARTVKGLHHVWCGRNGLCVLQRLMFVPSLSGYYLCFHLTTHVELMSCSAAVHGYPESGIRTKPFHLLQEHAVYHFARQVKASNTF